MAKRRSNGEGNIRKRKDGRWEGRYTAGHDPVTGKQVFKNMLGKTQAEVKEKLKKALAESQKRDFTKQGKYMVAQWMEEWFENMCKIKVRPSSHQTYRGYIDNHITPNIGKIPLEKLSTMDLQKLYRKLMDKGRVERIEAEHQPKGLCFFSRDARAHKNETKTVTGIATSSIHKSNVQNPTKNSNNTMNFKLSAIKSEKKRLSFAFSIAFANNGSSTNTTQKIVSFSILLSQKVAHFRMSTANKKKAMNTQ